MGNLVKKPSSSSLSSHSQGMKTPSAKTEANISYPNPYLVDSHKPTSHDKKHVSSYKVDAMGNLIPANKSPQVPSAAKKVVNQSPIHRKFDVMGNLIVKPTPANAATPVKVDVLGNIIPTHNHSHKNLHSHKSSTTKLRGEKHLNSKSSQPQLLHRDLSSASGVSNSPKKNTFDSPQSSSRKSLKASPSEEKSSRSSSSNVLVSPSISSHNKPEIQGQDTPTQSVLATTAMSKESTIVETPTIASIKEESPSHTREVDHANSFESNSSKTVPLTVAEEKEPSSQSQIPPDESTSGAVIPIMQSFDGFDGFDGNSIVSSTDASYLSDSLASLSSTGSKRAPKDREKEKEYSQLKRELRKWKADFVMVHGRDPEAKDFPIIEDVIKEKISRKNQLAKELEGTRRKKTGKNSADN